MAEKSIGCKFPRTSLVEPLGDAPSLLEAMEELLFFSDNDDQDIEQPSSITVANVQKKEIYNSKPQFRKGPNKSAAVTFKASNRAHQKNEDIRKQAECFVNDVVNVNEMLV